MVLTGFFRNINIINCSQESNKLGLCGFFAVLCFAYFEPLKKIFLPSSFWKIQGRIGIKNKLNFNSMLQTSTAQSSFDDYRAFTDKLTKQSNHSIVPPPHCLGNACQLELFGISPPDYGEKLREAIKTRSLTDCLDYFRATGLATDDFGALSLLAAWQGKQEINGRWDCPRCNAPSSEIGKKWLGTGGLR